MSALSPRSLRGRAPAGPVLKYYLYMATQAAWFVTPIWTLFLRSHGLSWTQVSALNATWWLATVLGEVPTGYVADRIGHRRALLVGTVIHVSSFSVFGLLDSFPAFLAIYLVWGVGVTFRSGTDSAWLYDTLEACAECGDFTRVKGRGTAVSLGAATVASAAGGYLANVSIYLPFALSAAVIGAGVLVVLTLPATETCTGEDCDPLGPREAVGVVRTTLSKPSLRPVVLGVLVLFAVGWSVGMFTQPVAVDVGRDLGLSERQTKPMLGWLYASFTAVSAVVTYNADRIEGWLGVERWLWVAPLALGASYVLGWVAPLAFAVPAFVTLRAVTETTEVLKDRAINDRTDSLGRATVLSAASMLFGLGRVPPRLAAGVLGDLVGPLGTMAVAGATLAAGTVAVQALLTDAGVVARSRTHARAAWARVPGTGSGERDPDPAD